MGIESFGKKVVLAAATVGTLMGGCKDKMQKYEGSQTEQNPGEKVKVKSDLNCKALTNEDLGVNGGIVYQTPGMPNETTVIGMKMIHSSKTYNDRHELNNEIRKLHDQIVDVLEGFMEKGMNNVGGEGLDYGLVSKSDLQANGLGRSSYAFIKMEMKHDDKVNSFWIDDTKIREKMLKLSHQGKPVEGIKLNPKREDSMARNIQKILISQNIKCVAVVAGAEHFEKERDPMLKQLIGDENLIDRLEKLGMNVVIVEPQSYGKVSKQLKFLKAR